MTLNEWFNSKPVPGRVALYKELTITDVTPVSDNYFLVEVVIPQPMGGYHHELVHKDTQIQFKQKGE